VLAERRGRRQPWPEWAAPDLRKTLAQQGILELWTHQAEAAELAWRGQHVVLATGTGSGKSLAFFVPTLSALAGHARPVRRPSAPPTALDLAPTKALAADQIQHINEWRLPEVRPASYDGDCGVEERRWAREHANVLLSNPDMLHGALLPQHRRWAGFLRGLQFVIIDESHQYRGAFGAHLAAVIRRLRRLAAHYGAAPTFIFATATVGNPAEHASTLLGLPVQAVTEAGHRRGRTRVALWEPPPKSTSGGARRSSLDEIADLLTDLVTDRRSTIAFVPSRRAVEQVTQQVKENLRLIDAELPARVAGYRSGYLAEDRRAIEKSLRSGDCLGVVSTSALELGVDISGLDVVLMAGWPGRTSAFWQRIGRAGRSGQESLAILIGEDNPLDHYLLHHPAAIFGASAEEAIVDPNNPYILAPHLAAAAAEHPLDSSDVELFGPGTQALLEVLVDRNILRRRAQGWFWARRERVSEHLSL
ncbi:MAG: DEAD/DEAH box helicase, partial [Angustibacter sp.]